MTLGDKIIIAFGYIYCSVFSLIATSGLVVASFQYFKTPTSEYKYIIINCFAYLLLFIAGFFMISGYKNIRKQQIAKDKKKQISSSKYKTVPKNHPGI